MGVSAGKEHVAAAIQRAGIDPGRRAETLTLVEWAEIYRRL